MFSSILKLNSYYNKEPVGALFTYPPLIKYEYFDDNNDGLIDRFKFKISFIPDNNARSINNLRLIFLFKYELKANIVGKMDTAAFIDINTPLGASYIKVNGNLNLKQKSPIDRTTFYNEFYYENVLDSDNYKEKINFYDIQNEYYSRKILILMCPVFKKYYIKHHYLLKSNFSGCNMPRCLFPLDALCISLCNSFLEIILLIRLIRMILELKKRKFYKLFSLFKNILIFNILFL